MFKIKMKKSMKILFVFFFTVITLVLSSKVNAYQLHYIASGGQIVDGESGVFVISMGNSYGGKPADKEYGKWYNSEKNNTELNGARILFYL